MPSAIVIGAGVFGASLADRLARSGWELILLDRREPGDPRSESGGETRLIRCSHGPDAFYARSARRALPTWRELGVVEEVGLVWFARSSDGWEAESERVLREEGIPVERVSPDDAARLFPDVRVDDLEFVLHEPEAGALRAADGVRALVTRAREAGARLLRAEALPEGAAVRAGAEMLEADAVVWACGAWLAGLFGELVPLRVTLQELVLFDVPIDWRGPGWVDFDGAFYGHGRIDPFGFKVGPDVDGPAVDPEERPLAARPSAIAAAREYLAHRFPAITEAPLASAPGCHYSLTADGQFLFDRHPDHDQVWLLGGGSGHGYKHGPALAEHVEAVLAGRAAPEPRFALTQRAPTRSLRTAGFGRGGGPLAG
ncbi:MAG TPA: FAD-dependent oxidoreductase [Thermoleophilaceae bacterium]|nr:FAD-dependent oxidoreductase [Thermoleophilaceae bacterium]